jgi:hypothetical protein
VTRMSLCLSAGVCALVGLTSVPLSGACRLHQSIRALASRNATGLPPASITRAPSMTENTLNALPNDLFHGECPSKCIRN